MTPRLLRYILLDCAQSEIPLGRIFDQSVQQLQARFGMKQEVAQALVNSSSDEAEITLAKLHQKRFYPVTFLDGNYPHALTRFSEQMPPLLYIFGTFTLFERPGIGFGGSRNVSNQGLHTADRLAQSVVKDHHRTVISGHAKGVDIIAHQSAVAAGGGTVLVLPEGALCFRLQEALRAYWGEASDRMAIVTQFAPNEPWSARNSMARNSTAIGLSEAYCVIEPGDEEGGTWAAGVSALNLGIPLVVMQDDGAGTLPGAAKLIKRGGIPLSYASKVWPDNILSAVDHQSEGTTQLSLF